MSGMTQKEFAEYFGMSKRAVESWDEGIRNCPEYLLKLMEYKLTKEGIITCTQIP
jgi:DNA-binding transcriptional regulator YiaG